MAKKNKQSAIIRARIIERAEANLLYCLDALGMPFTTALALTMGRYNKMPDDELAAVASFSREDWVASALFIGNALIASTQNQLGYTDNEGKKA